MEISVQIKPSGPAQTVRFVQVHTCCNFMVVTIVGSSTVARVLALRVLSDNYPVKLTRLAVAEG